MTDGGIHTIMKWTEQKKARNRMNLLSLKWLSRYKRIEKLNFNAAESYLNLHYKDFEHKQDYYSNVRFSMVEDDPIFDSDLFDNYTESGLFEPKLNLSFAGKLLQLMKEKNLKPSVVYKRAGIDKATFSRISGNETYLPSKDTVIAIALAAELPMKEADDLLSRAGYTLSDSIKRDVLLKYCFSAKIRNVVSVNCLLDKFGCKPLGRG